MEHNAFIVGWTMDNYAELKEKLAQYGFVFANNREDEHIHVTVPFKQLDVFVELCQQHLNAQANYIDVQYPNRKITVVIFRDEIYYITDEAENERVKAWAIALGLPPEQADWATSF